MSASKLDEYRRWLGVWSGSGETQAGQETLIRTTFEHGLDGFALAMHFEAWDTTLTTLYHGVHALLSRAPNGAMKAIAHSTIHGPLILELTPDDEGVMALAGDSLAGSHISVTFMEESADELMFAAFWRPPGTHAGEPDAPRMTCNLKRSLPFKPPGR